MATYSSILAWRIPWTEEPGGLQSMGSQKSWQDLATKQTKSKNNEPDRLPGSTARTLPDHQGKGSVSLSHCPRKCSRHLETYSEAWVWKIPCRRKWQPIPVFLLGESHGQRSLVGCSPWGCKRVGHD